MMIRNAVIQIPARHCSSDQSEINSAAATSWPGVEAMYFSQYLLQSLKSEMKSVENLIDNSHPTERESKRRVTKPNRMSSYRRRNWRPGSHLPKCTQDQVDNKPHKSVGYDNGSRLHGLTVNNRRASSLGRRLTPDLGYCQH